MASRKKVGLLRLFCDSSIDDVIPEDRKMVTAAKGSTVEDVLKLLVEKKILSVPVVDKEADKFLGLFDRQDLVALMLSMLDDDKDVAELEKEMASMPIEKAINKSLIDVFFTLSGTMSVNHLIEEFTRGVHRTTVRDENGTISNIVSQSDVARYVVSKYEALDTVSKRALNTPLESLGFRSQKVVTILDSKPALDGFKVINETKVDAVAVVDEEGKLTGTLSASDLRGSGTDLFSRLKMPISEFLKEQGDQAVASLELSVKEVIEDILEKGFHRLWIVDSDHKPVNCISLTNVMKALIRAGDHIENPKEKRKSLILPLQHASPSNSPANSPPHSPHNQSPKTSPRKKGLGSIRRRLSLSGSPSRSRSTSPSSSPKMTRVSRKGSRFGRSKKKDKAEEKESSP